jgi:exodeoxyribonuclease VII small subunit
MTAKPFEFEKSLAELEAITAWFESSDANLDAGLAKFERGLELANELKAHLATVENRVEKIRQRFNAPAEEAPSETEPTTKPEPQTPPSSTDQTDLFGT